MTTFKNIKIAIVSSSYHPEITSNLEKSCLVTLNKKGVKRNQVDTYRVPGSLEIPLVVKKLAKKHIYDAIITFGAIHKGKTYHFELIANECIRGCMEVSWQYEIPVIFEVLAVYDIKEAINRAIGKRENRGVEAALTALKMIALLSKL